MRRTYRPYCRLLESESAAPGIRVSLLPQEVPEHLRGSVFDVVAQGLAPVADVSGAERVVRSWTAPGEREDGRPSMESRNPVEQVLSRMDLPGGASFELLSSGMKRRVLLAQALVSAPDLLLLDEPTNHLDVDAITWLERFLVARWSATLVFVTHDRTFLRKLAKRILEIDRGRLYDWSCDYDTFLARKEAAIADEERHDALFDKKLAEEEAWIRRGVRARRTRNEGRVRALEEMRRERGERRSTDGKVKIRIQEGQRSGKLVAELEGVSFAHGDRTIVRDFSTTILRGDKVGIIGPNGAGKTTLLRLILGQLPPRAGTVRLGSNLEIGYFDQLRRQLRDDATVQENVGEGRESVQVGGTSRHIVGYLRDFLFSPERARTPVRLLSGGERNRVMLAKLFARAVNVIVLDEPTNDLDTETLELLEERLVEFEGTVLLVSHDRAFLDNVVTSTIVFEEDGVREYVGGYTDWLLQRPKPEEPERPRRSGGRVRPTAPPGPDGKRRLKPSERKALDGLPAEIEALEGEIGALHQAMSRPEFYRQSGERIAGERKRLEALESRLAAAYERWGELEGRAD
ncbi:MAG: ATP-binding cassette domain-containing protein [Acidobacteriia bacterium]|nr:ATP-binding cassette domain-containing protein [Terriglobia bacterium]